MSADLFCKVRATGSDGRDESLLAAPAAGQSGRVPAAQSRSCGLQLKGEPSCTVFSSQKIHIWYICSDPLYYEKSANNKYQTKTFHTGTFRSDTVGTYRRYLVQSIVSVRNMLLLVTTVT
jgi:hypothetical protein